MKACTEPGCTSPQFGGGYCKYHQYKRRMRGGDFYQPSRKKATPKIKRRTPKREKNEQYYAVEAKKRFEEAVAKKENLCFFCNKEVKEYNGWHHLRSRDGSRLRDWRYIVLAHSRCHLDDYHYSTYEKLSQQPWYPGFMERLKERDPETHRKELRKGEKSHKLNPKLFEEENE